MTTKGTWAAAERAADLPAPNWSRWSPGPPHPPWTGRALGWPVALTAGDLALHRTRLDVRGGRGDGVPVELVPEAGFDSMKLASADHAADDVLVGGWIQVSEAGLPLLSTALPSLVHVPAGTPADSRSGSLVEQLFEEAPAQRPGSAFAIRQNARRQHVTHELRRAIPHSRRRPALTYMSPWRMVLALRDPDIQVGAVAAQLGYGSESAFSTAFEREVGESPLHYRRRSRTPN